MERNKEFDNIIKQKMEGFVPSVAPSSWESLSEKMDAADVEDLANDIFDAMSRQKLHQYEVGYNTDHWAIMAAKLEREFYFVQELLRWKTMEVALMVLLLLTLGQFLPNYSKKIPNPLKATNLLIADESEAETTKVIYLNEESAIVESQAMILEDNITKVTNTVTSNTLKNNKISIITYKENDFIKQPSTIIPKLENNISLLNNKRDDYNINLPSHRLAIELLSTTEILPLGYIVNLMFPQPKKQKPKMALRIGMFGASNIDRIVNPILVIDEIEIPSYQRYALGYSGGISVGIENGGRWEYEAGVTYTSKRYTPAPVHFQAGSIEDGFSKEFFSFFEVNSLAIPVRVRYNYWKRNKWRLYAYGGASWQVNVQSYYHLASADKTTARLPPKSAARNRTLKDIEKGLVKGFFDKGGLLKNSYLTLDGGLGAERYVRNHWSVFSQVNYMHNVLQYGGGFGPFNDKINTLSISMGVKIRMRR